MVVEIFYNYYSGKFKKLFCPIMKPPTAMDGGGRGINAYFHFLFREQ
jgi:hypothetical protein